MSYTMDDYFIERSIEYNAFLENGSKVELVPTLGEDNKFFLTLKVDGVIQYGNTVENEIAASYVKLNSVEITELAAKFEKEDKAIFKEFQCFKSNKKMHSVSFHTEEAANEFIKLLNSDVELEVDDSECEEEHTFKVTCELEVTASSIDEAIQFAKEDIKALIADNSIGFNITPV